MAQKNSAPKSISWNREYDGTHGKVHVFEIVFDNGDKGQFTTTKKDQTKFKVGESVDYSIETLKNKNDKEYTKIDKITTNPGKGGNGGGQKTPEVQRSIVASVCLDCAAILLESRGVADQVDPELHSLYTIADKFFNHIQDKAKGDTQLSINYQSRLKLVVNNLVKYKRLEITDSDKILKYTDMQVEWLQNKMKG